MGQAVTVANASGDRLDVQLQSSVQVSEKAGLILTASSPPSAAAVQTTSKADVEVREAGQGVQGADPLPL